MDTITAKIIDQLQHGERDWLTWSLTTQGACTEIRCKVNIPSQSRAPVRTAIHTFSHQSRMRALRLGAKTDWPRIMPAVFITLTTPDQIADSSPRQRTDQREAFQRRMETYLGRKVPVFWRIEWKKRLSGKLKGKLIHHFHLIVCKTAYIPWQAVREWWGKSLHFKGILKTWIERIYSPLQASLYIHKYIAKNASLDYGAYLHNGTSIGRQWGVLRKSLLPMCPKSTIRFLWGEDVEWLKQVAREKGLEVDKYGERSFTMFGADLGENLELFFEDRLVKELDLC